MTRRHEAWTRHRGFDLVTVRQVITRLRWLRPYIAATGRTVIVHYHGQPAFKMAPLTEEEKRAATKILERKER